MIALFVCHANQRVGLGHLSRCRSLAKALAKFGVWSSVCGPALHLRSDADVFTHWMPIDETLHGQSLAAEVCKAARATSATFLVVDRYNLTAEFHFAISSAELRYLHFVDANVSFTLANVLCDAEPCASAETLQRCSPLPNAIFLAGPSFAVVRPEFRSVVRLSAYGDVRTFGIMFGGGDDRGATALAIEAVIPTLPDQTNIEVVVGSLNPRIGELKVLIERFSSLKVRMVVGIDNVAERLLGWDAAVVSGGMISVEAACCGTPMAIIAIVDNQERQALAFGHMGAALNLGAIANVGTNEISEACLRLLHEAELRARMTEVQHQLVDGRGAERVCAVLIEQFCSDA